MRTTALLATAPLAIALILRSPRPPWPGRDGARSGSCATTRL